MKLTHSPDVVHIVYDEVGMDPQPSLREFANVGDVQGHALAQVIYYLRLRHVLIYPIV